MKRSRNSSFQSNKSSTTKNKRMKEDENIARPLILTPKAANNDNSQRTSGGISKCLLTPCRRMGLTRNKRTSLNTSITETRSPLQEKSQLKAKSDDTLAEEKEVVPSNVEDCLKKKNVKEEECSLVEKSSSEPEKLLTTCMEVVNKKVGPKNKKAKTPKGSPRISNKKSPKVESSNKEEENKAKTNEVHDLNLEKKQTKEDIDSNLNLEKNKAKGIRDLNFEKNKVNGIKNLNTENSVGKKSKGDNDDLSLAKLKEKLVMKSDVKPRKVEKLSSSQKSSGSSYFSDEDSDEFESKTIVDRKVFKKSNKLRLRELTKNNVSVSDIEEIKLRIKSKQEKLDKLKRNSDSDCMSAEELETHILNWREICQKALEHLLQVSIEKGKFKDNASMEDLLKMLNIPHELVRYDPQAMAFEL